MLDRTLFALTVRLVVSRLLSGPGAAAVLAALAGLTAVFWLRGSFRAGLDAFLFLSPYVFLFSTADLVWSDSVSGVLENPLFLHGRFRAYLLLKAPAVMLLSTGALLAFFLILGAAGLARGEIGARDAVRFPAALSAGVYYGALGALLGTRLRAGSNVLAVLVAQAAAAAASIAAASAHSGWLVILDPGPLDAAGRLRLAVVAAAFPNLAASPGRHGYAIECAVLAALAFAVFAARLRGRELGR